MDRKLLLLINRDWTGPFLDRLMAVFSSLDFWLPFLIAGAVTLLIRGGFRGRAFLVVALLTIGFSDGLVSNTLKHQVNRLRPPQALGGVRQVDLAKAKPRLLALASPLVVRIAPAPAGGPIGRSFPSAHTINMTAMAVVIAFFFGRAGWLAGLVALLTGYSRIYTGAHWPSDVAASVFLGSGLGLFTVVVVELAWRRGASRWWPGLAGRHPSLFPA